MATGKDFGGTMVARDAVGNVFSMRGTYNLNAARQSNEAVTNQDGSVDRVGTPKPATAEITFRDDNIDADALMKAPRQNITIQEEFTGVAHYFTNAFFSGDPQVNRLTGETTGLTINTEQYSRSVS